VSKILSAPRDELVLPPLGRLPIRLEVLPQKGNPDYRKQITVHNLLNRADDATIEVTANNVDPVRRTLWHRRQPPTPNTHTHTHTPYPTPHAHLPLVLLVAAAAVIVAMEVVSCGGHPKA
jgi:hypothetical protein